MSSSDRMALSRSRLLWAGLLVAAMALPACSVRPLYSSAPLAGSDLSAVGELASIAIKPVQTRYAQEVRNHLIFLFGGGRGEPATPRYSMMLSVTSVTETAANLQIDGENQPSASTVTLRGSYALTDVSTGEEVVSGRRSVTSSYDVSTQEFAALRSQRDAENRAARELAEMLRLAIAQDLSSRPAP